jgi:outer membrane receptor protein involved in Fe transport
MFVQSTLRRAVRLALYAGGAAAALVAGTATAQDQDQDQDQSLDDVQTVVVTGSRIQRPELEAPVPTLVLGQEAFEAQGLENIADLAVTLPQFAPSFGTSRTQSTFSGAAASGLNNANLRNLGGTRSVVLVNGRRVPGGSSTSTSVDFNTLPTANIERIELLTGGAAAIYGADAVAGVVNVITKKDFEGIEIGLSYGTTAESDNENPSAHLMFGGSFGDRGRGLITLQYDKQGQVSCADRFLCAEDFAWTSPTGTPIRGPNAYSGVGLAPRIFIPGIPGSDPRSAGFTSRNGSFTDAGGNLIIFSVPVDGYNRNAARDIAIPTTRVMFAAEGDFQLAESVSAFAELNYGQSETDSQFEGHPFQSAQAGSLVGGGPGVPGLQASIPLNNPFVPAAFFNAYMAQNPTADPNTAQIAWFQRFNFFGFRGADNHRETVRGVLGLRGDIPFRDGWQWELSHVYGRTMVDSNTEGFVGTDRLYNGLRVEPVPGIPGQFRCVDAAARALGCVPVNPFGGYTQEMIDYLTVDAGQKGASELEDTLAYVSGAVFDVPAGSVQMAVGLERRVFSGYLDYDEIVQQGLVSGNQIMDTPEAEIETNEAYIETLVPVLKDMPFAHSLSIEGAFRKSESEYFSTSVDYDTWKYGGEWAPLEGMRFRAMRARSVRAPLPFELGGGGQTFGNINDPCTAARRNANATRAANCAADGVPDTYAPPLIVEQGVAGFQVGNDELVPEEATSLTYGLVLNPTFLRDFSLTVDRFQLEVDGFINTFGRQSIANTCYDSADRQFCDLIQRGTHPAVSGATYVLNGIDDTVGNLSTYDIRGYDVEARYAFDLSRAFRADSQLGKIGLQALMTIYDKAEQVARPGAATLDLLGFAGGSTSDQGYLKRQGVFNIDYRRNNVSASWQMRYIGRTEMTPLDPAYPEVGSHVYHNMRASLGFGDSSEVYLGVTNVFDKEPPFFATSTSGTQALDTIPGFYDVFGRSYYGGVRVKF